MYGTAKLKHLKILQEMTSVSTNFNLIKSRSARVPHPVVLDGGAVFSQSDLGGGGAELGQAEDGQVLVVQAGVLHDQPLHLLHHRQHPGLVVVGAVSWKDTKQEPLSLS